jgi:hypothetical protein
VSVLLIGSMLVSRAEVGVMEEGAGGIYIHLDMEADKCTNRTLAA